MGNTDATLWAVSKCTEKHTCTVWGLTHMNTASINYASTAIMECCWTCSSTSAVEILRWRIVTRSASSPQHGKEAAVWSLPSRTFGCIYFHCDGLCVHQSYVSWCRDPVVCVSSSQLSSCIWFSSANTERASNVHKKSTNDLSVCVSWYIHF